MQTRRRFVRSAAGMVAGSFLLPRLLKEEKITGNKLRNIGVQLYTFRKEMAADAMGTLQQIAALGVKEIETARSDKGHYYGLAPKAMKKACRDLGMTLRSGHVHIDDKWQQTLNEAAESGQEYLICSTMPTRGQTIDNYKKVAEAFNKAGEDCKKMGIKFGYHNHDYEFETESGKVLYDILLDHTAPDLVQMELDLGWVIVAGKDPLDYFNNYPGRFPLWHLKDMDVAKKHSVEFGKGQLRIAAIIEQRKVAGLKYPFIEQEEYASTPLESMRHNMEYLRKLCHKK